MPLLLNILHLGRCFYTRITSMVLYISKVPIGAIQVLRNADGGGVSNVQGKKRYEGVRFNVISVTRGWVGVQFPGKKHYVTLEWPHMPKLLRL